MKRLLHMSRRNSTRTETAKHSKSRMRVKYVESFYCVRLHCRNFIRVGLFYFDRIWEYIGLVERLYVKQVDRLAWRKKHGKDLEWDTFRFYRPLTTICAHHTGQDYWTSGCKATEIYSPRRRQIGAYQRRAERTCIQRRRRSDADNVRSRWGSAGHRIVQRSYISGEACNRRVRSMRRANIDAHKNAQVRNIDQ